jgi:hypothetical protein
MSYDIAVWQGERPLDDDTALDMWVELAERYLEGVEEPPTPEIARFVEALLARWPDLDESSDGPWASSRTGDASGPVLCVNIVPDRQDETSVYVAELARQHGLICFDPQQDRLRP